MPSDSPPPSHYEPPDERHCPECCDVQDCACHATLADSNAHDPALVKWCREHSEPDPDEVYDRLRDRRMFGD